MNKKKNKRICLDKKSFYKLTVVVLLIFLLIKQRPDKKLHLIFCDVGQGDATLIVYRSSQVLIDGGPDNSVLTCLGRNMPFWDRAIEVVVLTHPQADHLSGLIEVVKRYRIGVLIMAKVANPIAEFEELKRVIKQKKVKVRQMKLGQKLKLGKLELEAVYPVKIKTDLTDLNQISLVLRGRYGRFDFLVTGDIGFQEEKEILRLGDLKPVEILRVAHHGSGYSSSQEFLRQVKPELAVISVGEFNRFGHPSEEAMERIKKIGSKIVRTDKLGTIKVVSDGDKWWRQ